MKFYIRLYVFLLCVPLFCGACVDGSGSSLRLGGTVTGLSGTVVLQNRGEDDLTLTSDGAFSFSSFVLDGASYDVTVLTQPETQTCTVSNGSGRISGASVRDVSVDCATNPYAVTGSVTGLSGTVVLQNGGGDDLTLTSDGAFSFSSFVLDGAGYDVTVLTQPETQTCTVSNGSGTIDGAAVSDVGVDCAINVYTVTVSGDGHESLVPNTPQTVDHGSTQSFVVTADGGYALSSPVGGTCPEGSWSGSTYTTGAIISSCTVTFTAANANAPWYPSIHAFEHYDSGRSSLFSQATFAGDFSGGNTIDTLASTGDYPSLYNMAYIDADQVFAYGGGHGDVSGSIGAFVAQIDPDTLDPVWYNQLIDTSSNGEWDYPGVLGILEDGFLYVVYGYRLSKIDPDTGDVVATLQLPSEALDQDTTYNGFDATPEGLLVMKSLYRQAGCAIPGPEALLNCPDPTDVPSSLLVSVDPETMALLSQVTLPASTFGRVTVGTYEGQSYVYLSDSTSWLRYAIGDSGALTLDSSWNPGTLLLSGQNPASSLVVMGEWVIGQSNGSPATTELSVIAVNQGDDQAQFSIQPFFGDAIPVLVSTAFAPSISWTPSPVAVDPETEMIYAMDALPGQVAAISLDSSGLSLVWKADQVTTESMALIGSESERILVGTDIPAPEIPGSNSNDYVVWREAATGSEIARSPLLPQVTSGSMVQPYYVGDMFYGGIEGTLYRLMPVP